MAYKNVEIPDEAPGEYVKFNAIGDKLEGFFASSGPAAGKFGEGKTDYRFITREGVKVLTPPTHLATGLKVAALKPGCKVRITYSGNKEIGKESPMKLFTLQVDDEAATIAAGLKLVAKAGSAPPPAPKAPPPPPPPADDPFGDDVPI